MPSHMHRPLFKAVVNWTGLRGSGEPYEPHEGLRPQSRFPSIREFDGVHGSWDVLIEETLEYTAETRCSILLLSMSPRAPIHSLMAGAEFTLMDGPKEIATGRVISLDTERRNDSRPAQ